MNRKRRLVSCMHLPLSLCLPLRLSPALSLSVSLVKRWLLLSMHFSTFTSCQRQTQLRNLLALSLLLHLLPLLPLLPHLCPVSCLSLALSYYLLRHVCPTLSPRLFCGTHFSVSATKKESHSPSVYVSLCLFMWPSKARPSVYPSVRSPVRMSGCPFCLFVDIL